MKPIFLLTGQLLLMSCFSAVFAQSDTLADLRHFIKVCNAYKRLPVHLEVEIDRRANLITNPSDSSRTKALFCLRREGSYVEVDGVEQLVNDSFLLMVNRSTRQMTLFANNQPVADRFRDYLGLQLADSTALRIAGKYSASFSEGAGDTAISKLTNRTRLAFTDWPRMEVTIRCNRKTDEPYEVTQIVRKLVQVSKDAYLSAAALPEWKGKTVVIRDSSYFLVKEQVIDFHYRTISHDGGRDLPFRMSDRIAAGLPGKYHPVNGYADYVLTQQF